MGQSRSDGASAAQIAAPINKALAVIDESQRSMDVKAVEGRGMIKPNNKMALTIALHRQGQRTQHFMISVAFSIRMVELDKAIKVRCGKALPDTYDFFWIEPGGELQPLSSQAELTRYVFTMWWSQPWLVHVVDTTKEGSQSAFKRDFKRMAVSHSSKMLFERFDVNKNGKIV